MGLLTPLVEKRASALVSLQGDPETAGLFNLSQLSRSAQNVNPDTAINISTVFACVSRKAKTLAMLPLNVIEKQENGGKKIAFGHRAHNQLHYKPNRWQTSYDWRLMMHSQVLLRGNAYSKIVYHPGRGVNELIPMDPSRVFPFMIGSAGEVNYMNDTSPAPSEGDTLWYQYIASNGTSMVLGAREVLHIRGYSTNGIVGRNVVKILREPIGLAMATEEQGARLFSNGAQIGKVFTHPTKLGDDTYERLKKELNENTQGVANAHKTLILEDGMKIAQTTLTMEDAQFLDTRKFQVEEICSALDVPLILINRSGDKNQTFASAEQIISIFLKFQMAPDFLCWEQALNKDLLYTSEQNKYYFDFDFNALMRGDTAARIAYIKGRFETASITPDEIRLYEGESPTNTEMGKKYYLQSGMMPVDMIGKDNNPLNKKEEGDINEGE